MKFFKNLLLVTCIFTIFILISFQSYASITPIFSPENKFINKLTSIIKSPSAKTIDIAITSFESQNNNSMIQALKLAKHKNPNLEVRIILDRPDVRKAQILIEELERIGIDVRMISKTNNHKFIIVNGIHCNMVYGDTCIEDPNKTIILTGSGNFNLNGHDRLDDVFTHISENEDIAKEFSLHFARLWNHSKSIGINILPGKIQSENNITLPSDQQSLFTHANLTTNNENKNVTNKICDMIKNAKHTIRIAHTYLATEDVISTLTKKAKEPWVEIFIYLDGKNSKNKSNIIKKLTKQTNNVHLRFKYFLFGENNTNNQMRSKYIIIDDESVITGSYSFRSSSKQNYLENILIFNKYKSQEQALLIEKYIENFKEIWDRNRNEISMVKRKSFDKTRSNTSIPLSLKYSEIEQMFNAKLDKRN